MSQYNFIARKIHSFLGIIPIGVFIIVHFLLNSSSIFGIEAYSAIVAMMKGGGLVVKVLEVVLIALPLIFHGVYGLYITFLARNNAFQYTYYRNWAFYLQRITAIYIFFFLIWHVYDLRIAIHQPTEIMQTMVARAQDPISFVLYVVFVLAAAFHFANGKATFCMSWGLTVGPRSQDVLTVVSLATFAALSVLGIWVLFALAGVDPNNIPPNMEVKSLFDSFVTSLTGGGQ